MFCQVSWVLAVALETGFHTRQLSISHAPYICYCFIFIVILFPYLAVWPPCGSEGLS